MENAGSEVLGSVYIVCRGRAGGREHFRECVSITIENHDSIDFMLSALSRGEALQSLGVAGMQWLLGVGWGGRGAYLEAVWKGGDDFGTL